MFTLQKGDYKYIFEYDTLEELQLLLKEVTETHKQLEQQPHRALIIHNELDTIEKVKSTKEIDFAELELKFLAHKRKMGKVSTSTYKAYASTFKKLKEYFRKTYIYAIEIEDYEEFRDYLREEYDLKNKTINNHMAYVNKFLTFGVTYKLIPENNVKGLENFKEDAVIKENYTDEDIKNIFAYDYAQNYKNIFTIAAYSGMRVSEIVNLTKESVKKDSNTGIYYFDILKSKTQAGIRKVPIHKNILDDVLDKMNFPLLEDKSANAAQKAILRQLYKVIEKESTKSFHTFRGTFLNKCFSTFPQDQYLSLIQEIVGHSKTNSASLTVDTYAKGFELSLKKEIVDSVFY